MIAPPPPDTAAPRPSFSEALRLWARIGLTSFGGPAGQIAMLHRELVESRGWISEERFLRALNFCMVLPGPEAQQLATYVGWLLHGTRGGLAAGLLFVLPGFVLIVALAALYAAHAATTWVAGLFLGLEAAVLVIVAEALVRIARRALKTPVARLLAGAAFLALFAFAVPFPWVVIGAGLVGVLARRRVAAPGAGPAAPPVDWRHTVGAVLLWGAVWIAPIIATRAVFGSTSVFARLSAFFSEMALVAFGGAYAMLAWIAQNAAGAGGWISPAEMVDALALAETTPGPLILVLSFVAFLAGFRESGALPALVGGGLAAGLAAWAIFAPSFLWIFAAAPWVERLARRPAVEAALAGIAAAIVGVIGNLALWFGLHVLFRETSSFGLGPLAVPVPTLASFDPRVAGIAVLAGIALFRLRLGVPTTLALAAGAGVFVRMAS